MKKAILALTLLLFVGFFSMILPGLVIYDPEMEDCSQVEGIVANVSEGPSYDITIRIRGDERVFYINRGVESGLSVKDLNDLLEGNAVLIHYWDRYPISLISNSSVHITRLEYDGFPLYNEIVNYSN